MKRKASSPVSGRILSTKGNCPFSASSASTKSNKGNKGLWGAMLPLRSTRRLATVFSHCSQGGEADIRSQACSKRNDVCFLLQIVLEDVQQVVRQPMRAMALAVFFHLAEQPAQGVCGDALLSRDFLLEFAQPVGFLDVAHDDASLTGNDARDSTAIVGVARSFPEFLG